MIYKCRADTKAWWTEDRPTDKEATDNKATGNEVKNIMSPHFMGADMTIKIQKI